MPIVAFGLESCKLRLWTDCGDRRIFEPFAIMRHCRPTVGEWWPAGIWLAAAASLYAIEQCWWQPKLKRRAQAAEARPGAAES